MRLIPEANHKYLPAPPVPDRYEGMRVFVPLLFSVPTLFAEFLAADTRKRVAKPPATEKVCRCCGKLLSIERYSLNAKTGGRKSLCKPCDYLRFKEYREAKKRVSAMSVQQKAIILKEKEKK